jgi:hypothetical protein
MTCYALPDRHEPGVMRCVPCGLFWETADPNPPACRAEANGDLVTHGCEARGHNYRKLAFTADP